MQIFKDWLFPLLWAAYLIYWSLAAQRVKAAVRVEDTGPRLQRLALMTVAVLLLSLPHTFALLDARWLPHNEWSFWLGAAITAAGLAFSVCGRVYLGSNWSREVTVKQGHELITSGPYALVRHPIYTGLLAGILGTAVVQGRFRSIVALLLMYVCLQTKLKLEERFMREQFGAAYEEYSRRTAALIPYIS